MRVAMAVVGPQDDGQGWDAVKSAPHFVVELFVGAHCRSQRAVARIGTWMVDDMGGEQVAVYLVTKLTRKVEERRVRKREGGVAVVHIAENFQLLDAGTRYVVALEPQTTTGPHLLSHAPSLSDESDER